MTVKYGPRIAHQGEDKCPCDLNAKGHVWYYEGSGKVGFEKMHQAYWPEVIAYQLEIEIEPERKTVAETRYLWFPANGTVSFHHLSMGEGGFPVEFTVNYEDGRPVSGSWEKAND